MKKVLVLLILVSLLLLMLPLVSAVSQINTQEIQTTLLSQTPDPVEPGQIVKVKFKIENNGAETSQDAIVRILPQFPFTIYNDVAEKSIGKLRAVSTGADAAVVEFRLKVDEKAVEGDTELELEIQLGQASIIYNKEEFTINVQTQDAVLDVISITINPSQVTPGETAIINIMVKNLADSLLKDIKFKLDFQSSSVPLAPYQSSSERRISQLDTNFQNSLTFKVIADPSAAPGLYKIPLNITYNDENGNSYIIEDILAITIGEIPKLRAYIKKSTVMHKKENGLVTLEVANAGATDIRFLELYLLPSDDYQLISTSTYFYLGDVDSDDTESEEINLFIKGGVKTLHLPVMLKYYDANNQPFQQQFNLELPLYSSYTLKKFGLIPSSNIWIYLLLIIVAVVAFFLYRKYKKDPKGFSQLVDSWKNKFFSIVRKLPFIHKKRKRLI